MTRLVMDGLFEAGTYPRSWWDKTWSAQNGRDGSALGGGSTNTATGSTGIAGTNVLTLPAAAATVIWHLASYINVPASVIGATSGAAPWQIIRAGTVELVLTVNSSGFLELRRGSITGTLLATSSGHAALVGGVWFHLQIKATLHTSAGSCEVRLNGTTVINVSGVATAGTSGSVTALGTGNINTAGSNQNRLIHDDMVVLDTVDATATQGRPYNDFLGDVTLPVLLPTANGDSTQWTPSSGTNHAALVDESLPNTTDYVSSGTSGNTDLWAVTDLPASVSTVYAVQVATFMAADDAGTINVKPIIKESPSGAVTELETEAVAGTVYSMAYPPVRDTRPSDGATWTAADVNALQAGVRVA